MKAVLLEAHGGPERLRTLELPEPQPRPGEALVRVRACALNHIDLWLRKGIPGQSVNFPHLLGLDIAGDIVALPVPAEGLAEGQRVMLSPGTSCGRCRECLSGIDNACRRFRILGVHLPGGYAEFVRCPVANLVPIPERISYDEAAAFPLVFMTAWNMLVKRAGLKRGEDVLVWAAGSGVGMAAIQIAKLLGARVIATAGTEAKLARARELGADHVVSHRDGDVVEAVKRATNKRGVDVVFEHVGEASWDRSIHSLAHRGRLVTCGATTGFRATTDLRYVFAKQLSILGSYMGSKADLLEVAALFFEGRLKAIVDTALPLGEARRAHELLESSAPFGKIVLRV
jgi:NADPH:quinone reductase-like Zn-dependent oxidoreductase